jgi:Fe2+ or Zn2+ uptake regulation protein
MCEKLKSLKNNEFKIALLLSKKILSAKELQNALKVDKATIYRNIKSLLKKEIIREIKNSKGVGFYEINCKIHNPIHPHFECIICKKIYCLKELKSEDAISLSNYSPFEIKEIEIKFKGICNECKK